VAGLLGTTLLRFLSVPAVIITFLLLLALSVTPLLA